MAVLDRTDSPRHNNLTGLDLMVFVLLCKISFETRSDMKQNADQYLLLLINIEHTY